MSTHEARTATSADPVVALGEKFTELNRLWRRIDDDRERLEESLPRDHPARSTSTFVVVGERRYGSPEEICHRAREIGVDPAPLISDWHTIEEHRRTARKQLGLDKLDLAEEMARSAYLDLRNKIARTRSTSPEGIAVKIKLLREGLLDGLSGDELAIADSVLEDLAMNRSKFIRVA